MAAPRCFHCHTPLAKFTRMRTFRAPDIVTGKEIRREARFPGDIDAVVRTKAEAQRHVNEEVVSIRARRADGTIRSVGVWDGKSYGNVGDNLFCTNSCAEMTGRKLAKQARSSLQTAAS